MVRADPVPLSRRYWMPISLVMIIGSVVGAISLDIIPNQQFQLIFGGAFLLIALWFLFRVPAPQKFSEFPTKAFGMDLGVGAAAGFFGGFIGINAPPLVLHCTMCGNCPLVCFSASWISRDNFLKSAQ